MLANKLPTSTLQACYHYQKGTRSVVKYIDEFLELRAQNDLNDDEAQEIIKFVTKLKKPFRGQVKDRNVASFPNAITLATIYKSQLSKVARTPFMRNSFTD